MLGLAARFAVEISAGHYSSGGHGDLLGDAARSVRLPARCWQLTGSAGLDIAAGSTITAMQRVHHTREPTR
jgi:hypothetical protein